MNSNKIVTRFYFSLGAYGFSVGFIINDRKQQGRENEFAQRLLAAMILETTAG